MKLWMWFLIGVALGAFLVQSLKHFVERLTPQDGDMSYPRILMGFLGRHLVLAVILIVAIRQDPVAGILVVAGFWVGRWAMILLSLKSW
jgi:hypothetical protein